MQYQQYSYCYANQRPEHMKETYDTKTVIQLRVERNKFSVR